LNFFSIVSSRIFRVVVVRHSVSLAVAKPTHFAALAIACRETREQGSTEEG